VRVRGDIRVAILAQAWLKGRRAQVVRGSPGIAMRAWLFGLAAAGYVETLAQNGLTLVDRLPASQVCLAAQPIREIVYSHDGSSSPLIFSTASWASTDISGMIAGLLAREQLGIEVAFVEEAKGSSAMHRCVAGCLNPTTTTDAECLADPNRPLVHAAFEVWKDYVAWDDYADAALLPDRFLQPYDAFEGLFVGSAPVDEAYAAEGLSLRYYQAYDHAWNNPQLYFSSVAEVAATAAARGWAGSCPMVRVSGWMADYVRLTGDAAGVRGDEPACDPDGWWRSPACRAAPDTCVPFVTHKGWGLRIAMQSSALFNWSLAISEFEWEPFQVLPSVHRTLFYWWVPDTIFAGQGGVALQLPPHNANEFLDGRVTSMSTRLGLFNILAPKLKEKEPRVYELLSNLKLNNADMTDMLKRVPEGATYWNISCDWIKANKARWEPWVPSEGCAAGETLQTVLDVTSCMPCPEGTAGAHCAPCATGQYAGAPGSLQCDLCPPGTFANETGAIACGPCSEGTVASERGSPSCVPCRAGEFALDAQTCKLCPLGQFTAEPGRADCDPCPTAKDDPHVTTFQVGSKTAEQCT